MIKESYQNLTTTKKALRKSSYLGLSQLMERYEIYVKPQRRALGICLAIN